MKPTGTPLDRILERTTAELVTRKKQKPLPLLRVLAKAAPKPPPFEQALRRAPGVRIIPELKRKSPAQGFIDRDLDLASAARDFTAGGALAIAVHTEGPHFGGSLEDLGRARQGSKLPLLRYDFVIDEYQLVESRVNGASAVLLTSAALEPAQLRDLLKLSRELDLESVVAVHDEAQLNQALDAGAGMVAVDNRDPKTLQPDLATTETLAPVATRSGVLVISAGGVRVTADVQRLAQSGVEAFLVGEALLKAGNRAEAVRTLLAA